MGYISETRPLRRLDFDGQQPVPSLNHEVHLLTDGRAPVEDLSPVEPCVPPGQQIVKHQVPQMCPSGLLLLGEMQRHPGVAPVELISRLVRFTA